MRFPSCGAPGAMAVGMVLGLLFGKCQPAQAAETREGAAIGIQAKTPPCSWPFAVDAVTLGTNSELNDHNPDTAAAYWVMTYTVEQGLSISLKGRFPDSRYMSLATYTSKGLPFTTDGVGSSLTDYEIEPDPGSVNPWQHRAQAGGLYTVSLRSAVSPGQANVIPLAPAGTPAGTSGLLFLRVYVPASLSPHQVPLPKVSFELDGMSRSIPACRTTNQASSAAASVVLRDEGIAPPKCRTEPGTTSPPPGTPGEIVPFVLGPPATGSTPNTDTRYMSAVFDPPRNGDVLVIRAKAPSAPGGAHPAPWPASKMDVRYWSMCNDLLASPQPVVVNHLGRGSVDFGCRDDAQTEIDREGYYTFIVGTESQRRPISRIHGATFLPLSSSNPYQPYKVNLRNMLASPRFQRAIQSVPPNGSPASAAAVMGPYYPRLGFCSLRTLTRQGPSACPLH
jgi:hypothetical protein